MENDEIKNNRLDIAYEDTYVKYDCQQCKRQFIVGARLSHGNEITCPYCRSQNIMDVADSNGVKMDLGCLSILYYKYPSDGLMLYTKKELYDTLKKQKLPFTNAPSSWYEIMIKYCSERDGRNP